MTYLNGYTTNKTNKCSCFSSKNWHNVLVKKGKGCNNKRVVKARTKKCYKKLKTKERK